MTQLEWHSSSDTPQSQLSASSYVTCTAVTTVHTLFFLLLNLQAFQGMYPYPVQHPYDRYSMVDLERVDAGEWPDFGGVRGSVCILEPGDLLFVPQFWCAADLLAAWRPPGHPLPQGRGMRAVCMCWLVAHGC